jgi:hypothetical protein
MNLRAKELEFLSAWAQEEKTPDPYLLPAHQFQAANHVPSVSFIRAIKAWARAEGRCDEDIFTLFTNPDSTWPWTSMDEAHARLKEIASTQAAAGKV